MIAKKRPDPGFADPSVQPYETSHRAVARRAAAGGIVLLKNENNVLPLAPGSKVALYGPDALHVVIGGTGSGAVHVRDSVSVYQGLKDAGLEITTENQLLEAENAYQAARMAYRDEVLAKVDADTSDRPLNRKYHIAYNSTPFFAPSGAAPLKTEADTAIYFLTRNGGEGQDRFCRPGDFLLTDDEYDSLREICGLYPHVVFVLNAGGMIDLSFADTLTTLDAIVYMHQPGMEAGHALADVLCGVEPASGKLTDTWAYHYGDYPTAAHFSHNDGELAFEKYTEGIFVGYRYFDTFEVPVRYCFGYGLTYSSFSISTKSVTRRDGSDGIPGIDVLVTVKNTGTKYSGREVVQVYASCPQTSMPKEFRRLVGFAKTKLLAPGEEQDVTVNVPLTLLTSFDTAKPGWLLDAGSYGIYVGNSLDSAVPVGSVKLSGPVYTEITGHICPLEEPLEELPAPSERTAERRKELEAVLTGLPQVALSPADFPSPHIPADDLGQEISDKTRAYVEALSEDELIKLVVGEIPEGGANVIGAGSKYVPGAGGQTSVIFEEKGLPSIVFADGPAGLRLRRDFQLKDGKVEPLPFELKFADGFFSRLKLSDEGETRYQYCTAIPCETTLGMTWDVEALEACGRIVAEEMVLFGINVWLAPGMNLHRDPLCGRNFEYYAEDPLVSAAMASALTRGVESLPNRYTTLKHMACNNTEDNRMHSNSIISERTLRELYLKGYELAVKAAHPAALMTSYNKINGVHCANNYDVCTRAARQEWGFEGVFITDWTTTNQGPECTASGCIYAGNDLIMPGSLSDYDDLRQKLDSGALTIEQLRLCAGRIVEMIKKTEWYIDD